MQSISAFSYFLRTGRRLPQLGGSLERKFNPWHDPEDGRFTFAGQGRYFGASGRTQSDSSEPKSQRQEVRIAQRSGNPRIRMGGNGGPPLNDPTTLEQVFPGLRNSPGGSIVALAENIFDFSGGSRAATTELSLALARQLLQEIQLLEPGYRLPAADPAGYPATSEGQANLISRLRLDRAKAYYRKGIHGPYQVETLRFLQRVVDEAYELGLKEMKSGGLTQHLSAQLTLGNFIDIRTRERLREFHRANGIAIGRGEPTQVNRNARNTPEGSFRRPDSRIGDIAFDVSMERKNLSKPQIQGFFRTDFQPRAVLIVRPSKLGPKSTYIIKKP